MVSHLKKSNMNDFQFTKEFMKESQNATLRLFRSYKKSFQSSLAIRSNCFDQTQNFTITRLGKHLNKTTLKILAHITKHFFPK